jgi:hypothetical protein
MARLSLQNTAKFRILVRRIGLARPFVRGLLDTLWDVAHASGSPVIGDAYAVEAASEWPGQDGDWFAVLRDGGWLDELPDGRWQIHDYWDHAPDYVGKREAHKRGMRYAEFMASVRPKDSTSNPADSKLNPPDSAARADSEKRFPSPQVRDRVQDRVRVQVSESAEHSPIAAAPAAAAAPPETSPAAKPRGQKRPTTPRPPDELFDAIARVGNVDPSLDGVGSRIGRTKKALLSADPPYTPADVLRLPRALAEHGHVFMLTPEAIAKHIGFVRAPPPAQGGAAAGRMSHAGIRRFLAKRAADGGQHGDGGGDGVPVLGDGQGGDGGPSGGLPHDALAPAR